MLVPWVSTPLVDDAAVGGEAVAARGSGRTRPATPCSKWTAGRAGMTLPKSATGVPSCGGEDALGVDDGLGELGLLRLERR